MQQINLHRAQSLWSRRPEFTIPVRVDLPEPIFTRPEDFTLPAEFFFAGRLLGRAASGVRRFRGCLVWFRKSS
jgi:hypothetical protein